MFADKIAMRKWWWLAVYPDGTSQATEPLPCSLIVEPVPLQLLGFKTEEEQEAAVHGFHDEETIHEYRADLSRRFAMGDVAIMYPKGDPAPPSTDDATRWRVADNAIDMEFDIMIADQTNN